ncbi:MAG: SRPBCC domain-containing protein [Bacteroidota bacterium]
MTTTPQIQITKDLSAKKITVTRDFNATPEQTWSAWTESELLDLWWAPKPWKAETKSMEFRVGGYWLYAMVGPDNTRHWARVDFTKIEKHKRMETRDAFCDDLGNINREMPVMTWKIDFEPIETGSQVIVEISFTNESDLEKIVEMGFETGFASALTNLDEYFENQS